MMPAFNTLTGLFFYSFVAYIFIFAMGLFLRPHAPDIQSWSTKFKKNRLTFFVVSFILKLKWTIKPVINASRNITTKRIKYATKAEGIFKEK